MLVAVAMLIMWTILCIVVGYKSGYKFALGRPRIWKDPSLNNQRFYILGQCQSRTGGYYAVIKRVDPFAEPHCYALDKPLPTTPLFDRGNSGEEIIAVNLGGHPLFEPWKPV